MLMSKSCQVRSWPTFSSLQAKNVVVTVPKIRKVQKFILPKSSSKGVKALKNSFCQFYCILGLKNGLTFRRLTF